MFRFVLLRFLFFSSIILLGAIPAIEYDYFENDKSDLVDIDEFFGIVNFNKILKERFLFIGIRNVSNPNVVQTISIDKLEKIRDINPVGIILFSENFKEPQQTKNLIEGLKKNLGDDIFIAVDEEGGIVSRVSDNRELGVYNFPPMESIGSAGDIHIAYKIGEILGKQLRRLGINLNMAPVADAKLDNGSPLGSRTFGSSYYNIGLMVEAFIDGIQKEGVFAVVKHFPGLGGTKVDTHKELALLPYSKNFLMLNNFVPFLFAKKARFIMLGHVIIPAISSDVSSMSKDIVDIIRYNLNNVNIIITDAYDMGAIRNNFSLSNAVMKSLNSGIDVVLIPEGFDEIDIKK
uniref:beta-N-acetylhexosaminidase n=1 Tax=Borrelia lonestari TaxID=38876 RepID=A4ZZ37_9SPIR|nr:putative beta-N-acetylhexoseaminidase [Borrelia lonestari]